LQKGICDGEQCRGDQKDNVLGHRVFRHAKAAGDVVGSRKCQNSRSFRLRRRPRNKFHQRRGTQSRGDQARCTSCYLTSSLWEHTP
jgi:hypothetical protein